MKKLYAIILLAILAFNLVGYRFLFNYLAGSAAVQMAVSIDAHAYNSCDLFEAKVPLHMPYQHSSASFERFDGTVEVSGIYYNYVDRKIVNDTLIVHCIRNNRETGLRNAQNEFCRINDSQNSCGSRSNQSSLIFSILITGASVNNISYQFGFYNSASEYCFPKNNNAVCSAISAPPYEPPEIV